MESLTLSQLEKDDWGLPPDVAAPYLHKIYKLRHKPIGKLSVAEVNSLIQQDVGLEFLMLYAIRELGKDSLTEAWYYPGDLLCSVLRANPEYYARHPEVKSEIESIIEAYPAALSSTDRFVGKDVETQINEAIAGYRAKRVVIDGVVWKPGRVGQG